MQKSTESGNGALALVGLWTDVGDQKIEDLVKEIYAARARDKGRPVVLGD